MGVDLGERRIGLAISDPTGTIAGPLTTLRRRTGKRMPVQAMVDLATEYGARAVVFGLPLSLRGEETEWCETVRTVGDEVRRRAGVSVHFIDERMTSVRAERAMRSLGLPKNKREQKERVDLGAAVLILQSWLDREEGAP